MVLQCKSKLNGTNPVITSSMNVLRTVLQPTDNGKIAQESYFCYKMTNKLRFLIHLYTCFYYSSQQWDRQDKMYNVVLTNRSITRCAHDVMLWPVRYNKGIVFSGMAHLARALVNPSGEFLLLVIMSRLNSSTVPSLCCPLCMCGPLSDRGHSSEVIAGRKPLGGTKLVDRAPCMWFKLLQKHVSEKASI